MNANQLRELIQQPDSIIIDVRETWEFQAGHVEGSFNMPLGEVPGRVKEFLDMQGPIILVCASGNRSGMAANFLSARGILKVFNGGGWHAVSSIQKAVKRA
ncbi:MAG: rhodanese-like domain-containing protein [Saprospirales bacterium]|jgi:phage shock protein E|nr:rhodanese-like domain-containing protein [Saprospirales bacterium]MBK7334884.1 rhodanese-like domain-containing protein [Saprospirales bacterium]